MKASVGLIAIVLVAMTANYACRAASVAELEGAQSYHYKRSLCNTFGGCGAKRSLPPPQGYLGVLGAPDGPSDKDSLMQQQNKREQNPYIATESAGDLMLNPETNGKYKPTKYIILVPKQQYDGNNAGQVSQAQIEPADVQELRVGRIYMNRNE